MKISFDLDGVIADTDKWFFRLCDFLLRGKKERDPLLDTMVSDYFLHRPLKYHPNQFMADGDLGYIITSRRPDTRFDTEEWLRRHGIHLPIVFSDYNGEIAWFDYEMASCSAGIKKARIIKELGVEIHFDNNPYIVEKIRELVPDVKAVLIGGDRCRKKSPS